MLKATIRAIRFRQTYGHLETNYRYPRILKITSTKVSGIVNRHKQKSDIAKLAMKTFLN